MMLQDTYKEAHVQFGIDEVYIHDGLDGVLIKKLQQRSVLTLDSTDTVVKNNVSYDMLFIFHKRVAKTSLIYRFLEFLRKHPTKEEDFKKLYRLINEDELFEVIKDKKFVLITPSRVNEK